MNYFFFSKVIIGFNSSMIYESILLNKKAINLISNRFSVRRAENLSMPLILEGYSIDKTKLLNLLYKLNYSINYKVKNENKSNIINKILS